MDLIGSLFLVLAVTFLVGIYISRPFFTRQDGHTHRKADQVDTDAADRRRSALLAERDRALVALQDLEFDYTLGKIPAEDYPEQRALLLQSGATALRALDEMEGSATPERAAEDRLEAAVAARRADARANAAQAVPNPVRRRPAVETGDELEGLISERRRVRQEKAAGFCPKCGKPLQKSDHFCPRCGAAL